MKSFLSFLQSSGWFTWLLLAVLIIGIGLFLVIFWFQRHPKKPPQLKNLPETDSDNQSSTRSWKLPPDNPCPHLPPPTVSIPEKLKALDERLKYLEQLIQAGFPDSCRFPTSADGNLVATQPETPTITQFSPLTLATSLTMAYLQAQRNETENEKKIRKTEIHLNELLRRFGLLVSIRNGLQYDDLNKAKDHLDKAKALLQDIQDFERHPDYHRIDALIQDEIDGIGFMLDDLIKTIQEVESNPPHIHRRTFSQIQWQLKEQFNDRIPEATGIFETLKNHRITALYHLTDKQNLDSIRYHQGLYARPILDELEIVPKQPGGTSQTRNVDADRHTAEYVHLYLSENEKVQEQMRARGLDPVALKIDLVAATLKTTEFADGALESLTTQVTGKDTLSHLAFLTRYTGNLKKPSWFSNSSPEDIDAVVLVETGIPKKYILNLDAVT